MIEFHFLHWEVLQMLFFSCIVNPIIKMQFSFWVSVVQISLYSYLMFITSNQIYLYTQLLGYVWRKSLYHHLYYFSCTKRGKLSLMSIINQFPCCSCGQTLLQHNVLLKYWKVKKHNLSGFIKQDSKMFHFSQIVCLVAGDTMSVQDPIEMNLCAAVWAVTAYVVADLDDMLPRDDMLPQDNQTLYFQPKLKNQCFINYCFNLVQKQLTMLGWFLLSLLRYRKCFINIKVYLYFYRSISICLLMP